MVSAQVSLRILEASTALRNRRDHVEQVTGRASQSVKAGDHEHVSGLKPADHLGEFGSVRLGTRDLLLEHFGATGGHQFGILCGQVLVTGRNPRISELRHLIPPSQGHFRA